MSKQDCCIVIPTFYPGKKILSCLNSLPDDIDIFIVDNSHNKELLEILKSANKKIIYHNIGDVGLPKSFNFALKNINKKYILITQPDVIFEKDCIKNLLLSSKKYPNAGIISPLIFENGSYSKYDFMNLKFDKLNKKLIENKKLKNFNIPSGDFCVEAISATAMLLKRDLIKKIGGWDTNIYTYLEDIDLCLRLRISGHEIIKVFDSKVYHEGFSSHQNQNKEKMNISRIWHFTWSSIYFKKKYSKKISFYFYFIKNFLFNLFKILFYILIINKKKSFIYFIKLKAFINFIFIQKSIFRINLKK